MTAYMDGRAKRPPCCVATIFGADSRAHECPLSGVNRTLVCGRLESNQHKPGPLPKTDCHAYDVSAWSRGRVSWNYDA